jgi:hypothetical protein
MVGDSISANLDLAQMSCPQADPVRGCAAAMRASLSTATRLRFGRCTVPFCSSCSTAAQILLKQRCHACALRAGKAKPDNGLRGLQQRIRGMARALRKWLRGTRRPVSFFSTT